MHTQLFLLLYIVKSDWKCAAIPQVTELTFVACPVDMP